MRAAFFVILLSGTYCPPGRPYQKDIAMKKSLFLILIAATLLVSCAPLANSQLSAARDRWHAANISHYRFNLGVGCFCAFTTRMPLTIEVQKGRVLSMLYNDGSPVPADQQQVFASYQTIDALFDYTAQSLKADEIKIEYDPNYGFPTRVQIDFIKQAMDDELSLSVQDFQALP